jgi:pimeloyl-ACP methyl ester carboxylesterase
MPSLQPDSAFTEVNDINLHYLTWRPPSGGHVGLPPLLLLHPTGFLARVWQPVAEGLAQPEDGSLGHHIYAPDMRGHGDSDKPSSGYHWQVFVDDLKAFLDRFALRGIPVVGHSFGGTVATTLAAQHPEYFSHLILIEPIIIPPEARSQRGRGTDLAEGARRRRTIWDSADQIIESYRSKPTFERWRPDVLRLYAEHGTFQREDGLVELKCPAEVEAQMFDNDASLDVWQMLPNVAAPTLVIRGDLTEPHLASISESVSNLVQDAKFTTLEAAGHMSPMEKPEAIVEEVREFLAPKR